MGGQREGVKEVDLTVEWTVGGERDRVQTVDLMTEWTERVQTVGLTDEWTGRETSTGEELWRGVGLFDISTAMIDMFTSRTPTGTFFILPSKILHVLVSKGLVKHGVSQMKASPWKDQGQN